jgi:hypothetical protein
MLGRNTQNRPAPSRHSQDNRVPNWSVSSEAVASDQSRITTITCIHFTSTESSSSSSTEATSYTSDIDVSFLLYTQTTGVGVGIRSQESPLQFIGAWVDEDTILEHMNGPVVLDVIM